MSKLIEVVNTTAQTVAAGATANLGAIDRKYQGCPYKFTGIAIEIEAPGYYYISLTANLTAQAVGSLDLSIYNNGTLIPGAYAQGTTAAIGDLITLTISSKILRVFCGQPAIITLVNTGTNGYTIDALNLSIQKVA